MYSPWSTRGEFLRTRLCMVVLESLVEGNVARCECGLGLEDEAEDTPK